MWPHYPVKYLCPRKWHARCRSTYNMSDQHTLVHSATTCWNVFAVIHNLTVDKFVDHTNTQTPCCGKIFKSKHTHPFNGPCPGLPRWAGTRKVKPIWILLKQETVSGTGISWAICKSAPHSRQITMPAPHCSVFYGPDALPATQPTVSKHWRQIFKSKM